MKIDCRIAATLLSLSLTGCSSVPPVIRDIPPDNPSFQDAQTKADILTARPVRWGGTIVAIHNRPNAVELEILSMPLDDEGRPIAGDTAYGRFIAATGTAFDPDRYQIQRDCTVYGTLVGTSVGKIGDYDYTYPRVQALEVYVWPRDTAGFGGPNFRFGLGVGFGF